MTWFAILTITLIGARALAQLCLNYLNRRHVRAHAGSVPRAFEGIVEPGSYAKSVQYTLAKSQLDRAEIAYDLVFLLILLFSGVLPWVLSWFADRFGASAWSRAACLWLVLVLLTLPHLPLDWYAQFRLEERFGFNTTTLATWCADRLKGLVLGLLIGYPLLVLILKITEWTGQWWWLWAWAAVFAIQLLMLVMAPVLILPLFNKFTPLPEGSLRERLLRLAQRTGFQAHSIQVMDGSKRSRHSNAFFTGFGKFRKIVLFDTLIAQLNEPELEAVLAHEIGHYRRKHVLRILVFSAGTSLCALFLLSVLAKQTWFYEAFGFQHGNLTAGLLLFTLLAGVVSFWLSPLVNLWSRRYEYQADAFAIEAMRETESLIGALRKLNDKNLSNLTPHPLYSSFYYSHPTLLEREGALARVLGD